MMSQQEQISSFLTRGIINLDISIKCTLQCSKCSRQTDFKDIRPIPGHDMTIEEYRKIINFFPRVMMCGQVSDPIFNKNFPEFVKMSKEKDIELGVHTAASHKPIKWYEDIFDSFGKGYWIFGIDGLPKDSHKYRINQDGEKLFEIAKMCRKKGIDTKWQYIVFRYNENDIEEAKNMALDNGMEFELTSSSRWDENDPYRPINPKYQIDKTKDYVKKN